MDWLFEIDNYICDLRVAGILINVCSLTKNKPKSLENTEFSYQI